MLDNQSLFEVLCATHYLDIPILLEIASEVVKREAPSKISPDNIALLQKNLRNSLILHKILNLVGPAPARELAICRGNPRDAVRSVCVTKDNKIVSGSGRAVRVWDIKGQELAICRGNNKEVLSVCVTKDNKIITACHYDDAIRVCNMKGKQLAICDAYGFMFSSVCVMRDNKIVAGSTSQSSAHDNTVRVWDMDRNKELAICRGYELANCKGHEKGTIRSVCVTRDDKIVSGSGDGTVRIWDMKGKELAICRADNKEVCSVCVTKQEQDCFSDSDRTMRIWDMEGTLLAIDRGRKNAITSVCVSNDGKIISGSDGGTILVRDMAGKPLAICGGDQGRIIWSICVTKDGKIVSGNNDGTVRVWDIGLLNRIACMDEVQAMALWKLLQMKTQHQGNDSLEGLCKRLRIHFKEQSS